MKDYNLPKALRFRGRAHGEKASEKPSRHWQSPGQEAGGKGLWQGLCGSWLVSGAKERWRPLPGMAEGHVRRQSQAVPGLLRGPVRLVRRLPVMLSGEPWSQAPALSLQSLQPSEDSSPILSKGKDCCGRADLPYTPGSFGSSLPSSFQLFWNSQPCMHLPSPFPAKFGVSSFWQNGYCPCKVF